MKEDLLYDLDRKIRDLKSNPLDDELSIDVIIMIEKVFGIGNILIGIDYVENHVKGNPNIVFLKITHLCLEESYGLAFKTFLENHSILEDYIDSILNELSMFLMIDEYEKSKIMC